MRQIKTNSVLKTFIFITAVLLYLSCSTNKKEEMKAKAIDSKNFDLSVKPSENFFQYANGGWLKNNPMPANYSRYGSFDILQKENLDKLKKIFDDVSKKAKEFNKGSIYKIGAFYNIGMDTIKINKDGINPLKGEFDKINNIKTVSDLQKEIAYLHTIRINALFNVYSDQDEKNSKMVILQLAQGGLGLGDRDYYSAKDEHSKNMRKEYLVHVAKMFVLLGKKDKEAKADANTIMQIETKLADVSMNKIDRRDPDKTYNKKTFDELKKLAPSFDWNTYFTIIGLKPAGSLNVNQPKFFEGISKLITSISIDDWKTYLAWNLIRRTSSYLSSDFEKENFRFYATIFSGTKEMKPRWERVINASNNAMGEEIGKLFVKEYFPPKAKERMITMVKNLKVSYKTRIKNLDWMGEDTKKKAIEKLEAMNFKIGYPDEWIDYKNLEVKTDAYVLNFLRANNFNFKREMSKVNKPVDRKEWGMLPQTVNAYFNGTMNEIVFPAAILQPPFFFLDGDDAVNYGAIGAIIGHEITHGFDDQGRKYNKEGNLEDWWTKEDAKNFVKAADTIVKQFNDFKVTDTMHINGKLTLGENISDLGGLTVAYYALQNQKKGKSPEIDGLTPEQRFFLSYAQIWRQHMRIEELIKRIKEDPHSPGIARVNATVINMPEFYEAFNIKPTDKGYRPPEKRAKIW
ncbi:MAG: M13 family metallopeptidase [Bacteroidales bacterium]|nr:M13 family metallopeptidase [Bacteroidales bacterium]